jgi:hypothetical protein
LKLFNRIAIVLALSVCALLLRGDRLVVIPCSVFMVVVTKKKIKSKKAMSANGPLLSDSGFLILQKRKLMHTDAQNWSRFDQCTKPFYARRRSVYIERIK